MEYYDDRTLFEIGDQIGTTIMVDINTEMQTRAKFAKICVEVDLDKPLIPFYVLDGAQLNFEYEGIHMVCFSCGRFGHAKENCPLKKVEARAEKEGGVQKVSTESISIVKKDMVVEVEKEGNYGQWMMVERKPRRRGVQNQKADPTVTGKGGKSGDLGEKLGVKEIVQANGYQMDNAVKDTNMKISNAGSSSANNESTVLEGKANEPKSFLTGSQMRRERRNAMSSGPE